MSDLVVLAFDTETGAKRMSEKFRAMAREHLVELEDAAIVVRKLDGKAKVTQANNLVGTGALGGAFWGMMIGLVFAAPWLGLVVGAVGGAIGGKLTDIGIDDDFIREVGENIEPGQSALFLLFKKATPDKLLNDLKGSDARLYQTSLTKEDEAKLMAAFAPEE